MKLTRIFQFLVLGMLLVWACACSGEKSQEKPQEIQQEKIQNPQENPQEGVEDNQEEQGEMKEGIESEEEIEMMKEQMRDSQLQNEQMAHKPNIMILATGGTIAGSVDSQIKTTGYTAGVVGVDVLINAMPEIKNLANVSGEQVSNIDSANMTDEIWLKLANRVNELLADSEVDGIVITHGTDTMEESAYFLHLVVKSDKPVVLVGAMRPSTAMSADGPKNLYNAVALASSVDSKGKGVMVMMNDRVQSARYVSKTHALNVEAFSSPNAGDMGYVLDGEVFFHFTPAHLYTTTSSFDVSALESLPKVDILYSYANDGLAIAAEALFKNGTQGIVVAGSGAGSIHIEHKNMLKKLIEQGLVVVQSSRVNAGFVTASQEDSALGFIGARDLNPQKARVLLMLALTQTHNPQEIAKIFEMY